jgi:hypothetical protein
LSAFIAPAREIAGIKLRAFGAGALAQFQMVDHKFLKLEGKPDQIKKRLAAMPDLFEQIGQALYILAGPFDEVAEAVFGEKKEFRKRAMGFYFNFKIPDLQQAASKLFEIMGEGFTGMNYEVAGSGVPAAPNSFTRAGSRATSSASQTARDGAKTTSNGDSH